MVPVKHTRRSELPYPHSIRFHHDEVVLGGNIELHLQLPQHTTREASTTVAGARPAVVPCSTRRCTT